MNSFGVCSEPDPEPVLPELDPEPVLPELGPEPVLPDPDPVLPDPEPLLEPGVGLLYVPLFVGAGAGPPVEAT